jgi:hypothetical protein
LYLILHKEGAREELASSGDLLLGQQRFDHKREQITPLQQENYRGKAANFGRYQEARAAAAERAGLQKEVFFLMREIEDLHATGGNSYRATPPTLAEPQAERPTRGQYQRYFEEREELELIEIGRNNMESQKVTDELQDIMDGITELSAMLAQYRAMAEASRPAENDDASAADGSERRSQGWGEDSQPGTWGGSEQDSNSLEAVDDDSVFEAAVRPSAWSESEEESNNPGQVEETPR